MLPRYATKKRPREYDNCIEPTLLVQLTFSHEATENFDMKPVLVAGLLLLLSLPGAHAAVCADGVWRAGCVGPNGAAVVHKRPPPPPATTHACASGPYRAGCTGPRGTAVVRKPY